MTTRTLFVVFALACSGGSSSKPAHTTGGDPTNQTTGSNETAGSGTGPAAANVAIGASLKITPPDATVTVDDVVLGNAAQLDPVFALAPGLHTLVVSQQGFKPYRMEFAVTDKIESFTIKLEPVK